MLCAALLAPASSSAAPTPPRRVAFGVFLQNSFDHPKLFDRFAREVGRKPVLISRYPSWVVAPFAPSVLAPIWSRGAVPLVTWEPWDQKNQGFPLTAIAAGRYDRYIRDSARGALRWGKPVLVRFAHEMNGSWYPWGTENNTPASYIAAWRHVVDIFREEGADNVEWVWAPNVNEQAASSASIFGGGDSDPFPFAEYFPGDHWVDWVGLDGFNWGRGGNWQSFTNIFDDSYDEVIKLSHRPMIITETASNERGGNKAEWISSAFEREVPQFARISAVVWFNEAFNGVAARLDSSNPTQRAFRKAVDSPIYSMTREEFLATPRWEPTGPSAPEPPSSGYGGQSASERTAEQVRKHLPWVILVIAGLLLAGGLGAWAISRRRRRRGWRSA